MNKDLKGNVYTLPPDVITHLNSQVSKHTTNVDGLERAKTLLNDGSVNYNQLKRILHDMKYCDKVNESQKYNLWGGDVLEKWGWTILNNDRSFVKGKKTSKKNVDNITTVKRKNAFLQTHTKKDNYNTSGNILKTNSDKNYVAPLMSLGLFEEITKIKKMMKIL
jgi:hypothetical protein